ncbi:MAG TPA: DUF2271 domain-containing protein [Oligoflexus sp.]|uniref:DUF2271 domain-containing protein n=1 Tax=Oligoflexus sp. TaxID=1971216 RepID=UPI002D809AEE|nr:DUF2271 domain-containing protein [Oligoflexus sp.]HET9238698.1 DUF2271 domain-containing protein [Oligoflexus sp.]
MQSSHKLSRVIYCLLLGTLLSCSNETRPNPDQVTRRAAEAVQAPVPNTGDPASNESPQTTTQDPGSPASPVAPQGQAPTMATNVAATGKVVVDFTPVAPVPAGRYAPSNIMAVFVTDANNTLVRTLFATPSGPRAMYLRRWQKLTGTQLDGFTGATLTAVAKPPVDKLSWDMKNRAGVIVPNGNYKLWFEIATDNIPALAADVTNAALSNALPIDTARGYKNLIVPIVVGPAGSNKTDTTNQAFTNVSIVHTP